jgi:hypothetical protein
MGSRGIKRRKPVRHSGEGGVPPNIMWPEHGSGYEVDPLSPAGQAQARWRLIQGLGAGRLTRVLIWLALAVIAVVFVVGFVNLFSS